MFTGVGLIPVHFMSNIIVDSAYLVTVCGFAN